MQIIIEDNAVEHIKKLGGIINISCMRIGKGCSGGMNIPTVQIGEPSKNKDNYKMEKVDEIIVYISPSLALAKDEIKISLKGFWFMKDLEVKGLKCV